MVDHHDQVRIILVEDNPDDVCLAQRAFRNHGLTNPLRIVSTGGAALDVLRGPVPAGDSAGDLVLLDLRLPGMDGLEVLRAVRGDPEGCRVTVIVLTSANAFDDIDAAYAAGANAVLFKPIDFGQLVDSTAELGLGWQLVDERQGDGRTGRPRARPRRRTP